MAVNTPPAEDPNGVPYTILTRTGAERLTERARKAAAALHEILLEGWYGRVWEALNLPSFDAWVTERVHHDGSVRVSGDYLRTFVAAMDDAGFSVRRIAKHGNISTTTVQKYLPREQPMGERGRNNVVSIATRQPVNEATAKAPAQHYRVADLAAEYKGHGITSREAEALLPDWRQSSITAAFHRAKGYGLVAWRGDVRDGFGVYVRVGE